MKKIIEIEKRFEKNLIARFNEGNAVLKEGYYEIDISCELCDTYSPHIKDCKKCPFNYFAKQGKIVGCDTFIRMITHTEKLPIILGFNVIRWDASKDKEVRAFLRLLCKEAKKRIRFM